MSADSQRAEAIRIAEAGQIELRSLISSVLSLDETEEALTLAAEKGSALKVQLEIN